VRHYGYNIEVHKVETKDGYILEVHRIMSKISTPNNKTKPAVLLQHGLLSSSLDWLITGPKNALGNYKIQF
jgi:hypothetical protein